MSNTAKIKLTPKQKEVIKSLREKPDVFRWIGMPTCKFYLFGKTFRYDLADDLRTKGLIIGRKTDGYLNTYYELTELGKTIEL